MAESARAPPFFRLGIDPEELIDDDRPAVRAQCSHELAFGIEGVGRPGVGIVDPVGMELSGWNVPVKVKAPS